MAYSSYPKLFRFEAVIYAVKVDSLDWKDRVYQTVIFIVYASMNSNISFRRSWVLLKMYHFGMKHHVSIQLIHFCTCRERTNTPSRMKRDNSERRGVLSQKLITYYMNGSSDLTLKQLETCHYAQLPAESMNVFFRGTIPFFSSLRNDAFSPHRKSSDGKISQWNRESILMTRRVFFILWVFIRRQKILGITRGFRSE